MRTPTTPIGIRLQHSLTRSVELFQLRTEIWGLRTKLVARKFENQWLRWRLSYLLTRRWRRAFATPDPDRIRIHPLDRTRTWITIMRRNQEIGRWN